ncbi:hypothetical protein EZS27_003537 [termite gut metagenome]|uniref:Uncharacterized protein n=1 Tax=termite gut metagenome TaxID=433724 RepID=A0A5J4SSA4_9ZZZZ
MLDDLKVFKSLFSTNDAFVEHVVQSIYFFEPAIVQYQTKVIFMCSVSTEISSELWLHDCNV